MRVNITLLGMVMVDCWRIYVQLTQGVINSEEQKEFYTELATELIDNNYDTIGSATKQKTRSNNMEDSNNDMPVVNLVAGQPRCGISAHLTPTKCRQCDSRGNLLPYSLQGRCCIFLRRQHFIVHGTLVLRTSMMKVGLI